MNSDFGFDEPVAKRRGYIMRMALLYAVGTIAGAGFVVLAMINILDGRSGYMIMLVVFGIPGLLMAVLLRQYVSDISAVPVTVEGEVQRKWHKSNLLFFFMPAFYINVERKIFSIPHFAYASLLETDLVRVRCFPRSLTVEEVERYDETEKRFVPADIGPVNK